VNATSLAGRANTVRICVSDTATNVGSQTTTVTKDTTAPVVTIDGVSKTVVGPSDSSNVTWHGTENGAYSVRLGGTSCSTGTQLASGSYTTAPGTLTTAINASSLAEGANTIRVCVTDVATNTGSQTTSLTKDSIAPVVTIDGVSKTLLGPV